MFVLTVPSFSSLPANESSVLVPKETSDGVFLTLSPLELVDLVVDIMFIIDIIINFRTTFISTADEVKQPVLR
jgi:hypothetical protein